MKKNHSFIFILCTLLFLFVLIPSLSIYAGGSKVWKERLKKCDEEKAQIEGELSSLKSENSSLSDRISRLTSDKTNLEQRIADLERQIDAKDQEIARLEQELAEAPDPMIVSKSVQEVQQKEAEIIDLKMERDQLKTERDRLQSDVRDLNRQIAQLNSENLAMKRENERLSQDKQNLTQQNQSLAQQNQKLTDKTNELYKALEMYEGIQKVSIELMDVIYERLRQELSEEIRQGKVRVYKAALGIVVDVTTEDMFDVGSVVINPQGKAILTKVGRLLRDLSGNYFIGVIGNADSKPIVTPALKKRFPTNWELSAARGSTVVRYLIDVSNLSASRFVSMGFGEFQPIDTNKTVAGRGKNRRIDITLLPIDVLAEIIVGAEVQ